MSVQASHQISRKSRAVKRVVEPGNTAQCARCGESVKFQARVRQYRIICNVYVRRKWNRVEQYHIECYQAAGEPYGSPDVEQLNKVDVRQQTKLLHRQ